jgi:general secretion pathway protein K
MRLGSSRGIALISVLWITGLLAVIAASFASSTRTEARLARNLVANAKAEAIADGGVHRAVLGLLDPDPATVWRADRTVYAIALGEGEAQIEIEDEDGKIDLNGAPPELLAGLLGALGLEAGEAEATAARIADYRDEDNEPEPQGAEDPEYLAAGRTAGAADRAFASESELLNVLGMSQVLYEEMRPYVTVYSGAEGVDPTRAPRLVLEALPGMTPELLEALLAAGPEVDPYLAIEDQGALEDLEFFLLPTRDLVFTIRAVGRSSEGGTFLREAVIELGGSLDQAFLVHAWRRGTLRPEAG